MLTTARECFARPAVARFVEALQAHGFLVGKTDDPRALDLVFEFNRNPYDLRVSPALWSQGIPVLTGSATNPGWGTALARGSAVASLAYNASRKSEGELIGFVSHIPVVPDRSASAHD